MKCLALRNYLLVCFIVLSMVSAAHAQRPPAIQLSTELANFPIFLGNPQFSISPDSSHVVYLADKLGEFIGIPEVYSVPITGGGSIHLGPSGLLPSRQFAISPNSEFVIWWRDSSLLYNKMDGSELREIAATAISDVVISPDSRYVLYTAPKPGATRVDALYSFAVESGEVTALSDIDVNPEGHPGRVFVSPQFTSDSSRIVFTAIDAGAGGSTVERLYSISPAGDNKIFLAEFAETFGLNTHFELSDLTGSVFFADARGLSSVPVMGGDDLNLADDTHYVNFRPVEGNTRFLPLDSCQCVIYLGKNSLNENVALYRVSYSGGDRQRVGREVSKRNYSSFKVTNDELRLVYVMPQSAIDSPGTREVYSVPVSGGASVLLSVTGDDQATETTRFSISNDDKWVTFAKDRQVIDLDNPIPSYVERVGPFPTSLFRSSITGGETIALSHRANLVRETTEDSHYLVYLSNGEINSTSMLGGSTQVVATNTDVFLRFALSNDSKYVVYKRQLTASRYALFTQLVRPEGEEEDFCVMLPSGPPSLVGSPFVSFCL